MPRRYFEGAPDIVRAQVLDIIAVTPAAPLGFDVILKPEPAPRRDMEITGLDFGDRGEQGCHFFLRPHDATAYRDRNRRKRRAWRDLPEATQRAIVRYLES
jgi:hypothetical protein